MIRINLMEYRKGYDGRMRSWAWMEREHRKKFKKKIYDALDHLIDEENMANHPDKVAFLRWCRKNTYRWLVAKPKDLQDAKDEVDKRYIKNADLKETGFRQKIHNAYGYDHSKLLDLAKWLNVKTCPYCNMQYTLYVKAYKEDGTVKEMAKLQFDHFYNQADYPMFSMSMYNLIPSCASCNLGKKQGELALAFHPYHANIGDSFRFKIANPHILWMGNMLGRPKIKLERTGKQKIGSYNDMFHIGALYQRHVDFVQEVFARAYPDDSYYGNKDNFPYIKDKDLVERLQIGFYPKEEDIELRPLTKFEQDLWKQAKSIYYKKK